VEQVNHLGTDRGKIRHLRLKKFASARTVETPLMLIVPLPSSIRLNQEALMTIASVPAVLGEVIIAYAFVPLVF
jgi:hypothetical protein